MADTEEKTLPPTLRRRETARREGQVARSSLLGTAFSLLGLVLILHTGLPGVTLPTLREAMTLPSAQADFGFGTVQHLTIQSMIWAARLLLPILLLLIVISLAVGIAQAGFRVTPEALAPRWSRLSPAEGLKRLFSRRASISTLMSLLQITIIGIIVFLTLRTAVFSGTLLQTLGMPLPVTLSVIGDLLWQIGLRVSAALIILAIADYAYQRWEMERSLQMSRQELRDEQRQTEISPETRTRLRRIRRQQASATRHKSS